MTRAGRPHAGWACTTLVKEVVAATGVLKRKQRRARDSTVSDDAVATQNTVTQLVAAIRRVIREVPAAATVTCPAGHNANLGRPAANGARTAQFKRSCTALHDSDDHAAGCTASVLFEVEPTLEGLVDRLDHLP